jgi:broad specificity phosphatase PhoE
MEVQVVDGLIEVDVGLWEGRAWDDIRRTDPDAYQAFMSDAGVNPYLGGENMQTVWDRVVPAFEQLMAENVGRRIAAVAHNVVNRVYLSGLLGVPLASYRSIPQDNCGVNLLRYRDGRIKAITVNGLFHLESP